MDNQINDIMNNTQQSQVTPEQVQPQVAPQPQVVQEQPQVAPQPTYVPPVYNNVYPPQYQPNTYSAPHYTAPTNYNVQIYDYSQTAAAQAPVVTYNNSQAGTVPQYHYGTPNQYPVFNNSYYEEQRRRVFAKKEAEKKIRSISSVAGIELIVSFFVSNLFSFLLFIPFVRDIYMDSLSGSCFINIIYSLVCVAGTFMLYDKVFSKHAKKQTLHTNGVDCYDFRTSFDAPKNPVRTILLIFIGFAGCLLANYVSNIFLIILELFDVHSTYSAMDDPESVQDIISMCIGTAVIPPLIEELAIRGFLMSRMRRYGNVFAIVTSAFIFGVFHGTVAQIPFAFICGLFMGYAVIATNSIWTGVIIHAMNNALSCIGSILMTTTDEETANMFFSTVSSVGIGIGIVCFIIYFAVYREKKASSGSMINSAYQFAKTPVTAPLDDGVIVYQGDANEISQGRKLAVFFKNPAVIIGTVLYLVLSLLSLEF